MFVPERAFAAAEGICVPCEGFRPTVPGTQEVGNSIHCLQCQRMRFAECALLGFDGALVELQGLLALALVFEDYRQASVDIQSVGMVSSKGRLADFDDGFVALLCCTVAPILCQEEAFIASHGQSQDM